jgi:hypothetical protein
VIISNGQGIITNGILKCKEKEERRSKKTLESLIIVECATQWSIEK